MLKGDNPVDSLDVTILQNLILDPILGITDMRSNPRLDYIAGISTDEDFKQKCDEGWENCIFLPCNLNEPIDGSCRCWRIDATQIHLFRSQMPFWNFCQIQTGF